MNKTDYKSLDITEEEIGAVRRYISNAHISMNALLDIDPEVISAQQSKGWVIDFSKQGIDRNIEYLEKLYSAMYKYSLQAGKNETTVYRGTSRNEVAKLQKEKVSGRFLSTTTDRDIAMRFTEYRNGALFTMSLEGVPYIRTDAFLDETQVSESEVLVSPFSKIENIETYSVQDIDGVNRYSAKVIKQEFENITDEERKQYEENISSFNYEENLALYKDLSFKLGIMQERVASLRGAKTKDEREELEYMINRESELSQELNDVKDKFRTVKQSMNRILQDKFKTIELEVQKGLEQDKSIVDDEERKRQLELTKGRKEDLLKRADKTRLRVLSASGQYESMDKEEQILYDKAKELGLDISKLPSVDNEVIAKFERLKSNIEEIKREIAAIEMSDGMTKEDMAVDSPLNDKLKILYDKLSITNKIMDECEKTIAITKENSKRMLGKDVAAKLGEDLTTKVREDLIREEQTLLEKKDSLWDKLTGKAKVRAAQVENIRLRRQFVERGGLNTPKTMEELITYASKYREVLGEDKLPESLKNMLPKSNGDVEVSDEEREVLDAARTGTSLIPLNGSKKQILSVIEDQNANLNERMQLVKCDSRGSLTEDLGVCVKNSVERCLDTALFYTEELPEEEKQKIMQYGITL